MIAILQINGKQYKVSKGDKVLIDSKIDIENGKVIDLDQVLAISDNDKNIFNPKEDRKSTRLNSSHSQQSRMPSSA